MWPKIIFTLLVIGIIESNALPGSYVLSQVPLIDGHNDLPEQIYSNERNVLAHFNFNSNLSASWNYSQTDLPRLRKGKVGGQFWVAYAPCASNYKDAVERTLDQIDLIKRLIDDYPKDLELVTSSFEIWSSFGRRRIASLIGVEGGHSIDSRLSILRLYYQLGVRYLTLTHNCNTPWADNQLVDQSNATAKKNLTEFGKAIVEEMNRLGMLIDLSHTSKGVQEAVLNHSKSPVIYSHSSAYGVYPHTRNVHDDVLQKLKQNGGIVMVNFGADFLAPQNASILNVIDHLNHIKNITGPDHIGLGADYDGVSPPLTIGLEDVSKYPVLFDLLSEQGWTQTELRKLAGLNLIRVLQQGERIRDQMLRNNVKPLEYRVTLNDLKAANATLTCKTDV